MKKLPRVLVGVFCALLFFSSPGEALAVTIASQTQVFADQLITNKALQELGSNLSGTAGSFTFRVSTARTNLNQFNFTVQNSRIYDKNNNSFSIIPCIPSNANSSDPLAGLTFNTSGVPTGFEDVTLDFSCNNYQFVSGHRYLIVFGSANFNSSSGLMLLGAAAYGAGRNGGSTDLFTGGGLRYSNGNLFDYSHGSGVCSGINYIWNDSNPTPSSGCFIWTTKNDDLYFVLTNTAPPPPPPRLPVIFIAGIGGSELKTTQDTIWSASDGHGGTYSHAYPSGEKVWVNQDEAVKLGDDDYFDILRLKADGVTPEASLGLTGNLTSFGYGDIDNFFTGIGYVKGTNFFVFNYDWRKDVRSSKDSLDSLIEQAKTASGQSKVNLVVHSLGGLVSRYYISDSTKAAKVNKLIELGVPHLGAPFALKTLVYGTSINYRFKFFEFPIIPGTEIKDVVQNLPSHNSLIPSTKYFDFYNNSDKDHPYPFKDDRDIDSNSITGSLNYSQTKSLLTNLGYNMTVFNLAEQFHSAIDPIYNQTNAVKVYEIVGSNQPTLGQIQETWWITWPINLIPKTDEIFINGDDTVPLYSATLKTDSLDLSGAYKIYYVDQKHTDLVNGTGTAMLTVKSILNDDNAIPVDVKDQKINLEGEQVSVDDANLDLYDDSNNHTGLDSSGNVETNIPNTFYDSLGKTKHIFVKKTAKKSTAKITSSSTTKVKVKIRNYSSDSINKTTVYNDVPVSATTSAQLTIDPTATSSATITSGTQTISPSYEATGSAVLDQTPPTSTIQVTGVKNDSGVYAGPVTITLSASDSSSGIFKIEYSLDNGQTVQTYTNPFTISNPGTTTIQVKAIDNLGNEEIPQVITIEIAPQPTPTPTPTPTPEATASASLTDSIATGSAQIATDSAEIASASATPTPSPTPSSSSPPSTTTYTSSSTDNSNGSSSNSTSSPTPTPNPTSIPTSTPVITAGQDTPGVGPDSSGVNSSTTQSDSPGVNETSNQSGVLGVNSQYSNTLEKQKDPAQQILGGLLIVSGGIATIAGLGFAATFVHPIPK